ncbi:MAG: hypothetical protein KA247_01335 [Bacteroidetes bacterium]|nr:hypothetical protein [Bacteroidota bacterium]
MIDIRMVVIAYSLGMIIVGCTRSNDAPVNSLPDMYVSIELGSAFQDDSVRLMLDGKQLVDERISTNYTIGLAWSSGLQRMTRNSHFIHFDVPTYGARTDLLVSTVNDTSTVLLEFEPLSKQISVNQIKGRYLRD